MLTFSYPAIPARRARHGLCRVKRQAQTMTTGIVRLNWLFDASSFFNISSRPSSAVANDVLRLPLSFYCSYQTLFIIIFLNLYA